MKRSRKMLLAMAGLMVCMSGPGSITVHAGHNNDALGGFSGGIASLWDSGESDDNEIVGDLTAVAAEEEKPQLVMANVKKAMNIRSEAKDNSQKVGMLYKDCGGIVLERQDGWTKLQSGNLVGWAKDDLLLFDEEAAQLADSVGRMTATVVVDTLRVRREPDVNSETFAILPQGEVVVVSQEMTAEEKAMIPVCVSDVLTASTMADIDKDEEVVVEADEAKDGKKEPAMADANAKKEAPAKVNMTKEDDAKAVSLVNKDTKSAPIDLAAAIEAAAEEEEITDWIRIDYEGQDGYISAECVSLEFTVDTGETMSEIKEKSKSAVTTTVTSPADTGVFTNNGAYETDYDTKMLLAALIHCEAGGESYEGQVAVGAVVLNRVRSGAYPNSIHDVIYQSWQFTPAHTGKVDRVLASGNIYESCIRAAEDALSGTSPVGTVTHFRRNDGRDGQVIGNHVFY